jgi:hypothetical protein
MEDGLKDNMRIKWSIPVIYIFISYGFLFGQNKTTTNPTTKPVATLSEKEVLGLFDKGQKEKDYYRIAIRGTDLFLPLLHSKDLSKGDMGLLWIETYHDQGTRYSIEKKIGYFILFQKINDTEILANFGSENDPKLETKRLLVYIKNFHCEKADGEEIEAKDGKEIVFKVVGTKTYSTTFGSSKTIYCLEPVIADLSPYISLVQESIRKVKVEEAVAEREAEEKRRKYEAELREKIAKIDAKEKIEKEKQAKKDRPANELKAAKLYLSNNLKEKAKEKLQSLIDTYPNVIEAEEARKIISELNK